MLFYAHDNIWLIQQSIGTRMPFKVQPWHVYTCIIISILFCLAFGLIMFFFVEILPDYRIHLYEKRMLQQEAMFQKKIDEQKAMFDAQRAIMHEKEVMLERKLVINKQMHIIEMIRQGINEAHRLRDHHIARLREYSFLKEKSDDWFDWLTTEQNARMNQLENDYVDFGETLNVNVAMDIVKRDSEKMVTFFSSQLEVLEDALDEMDIEKMKKCQKEMKKQHVHIPSFFQMQTEHIKSNIRSSSNARALQTRGRLAKVAALFYNIFMTFYSSLSI